MDQFHRSLGFHKGMQGIYVFAARLLIQPQEPALSYPALPHFATFKHLPLPLVTRLRPYPLCPELPDSQQSFTTRRDHTTSI